MTVLELITDALKENGVLDAENGSPSSGQQSVALTRLNLMMDSWAVDGVPVAPFAAVGDTIEYEGEYTQAMLFGLAVQTATVFGMDVAPATAALASQTYETLVNSVDTMEELDIDAGLLPRRPFNINTG